MKPTAISQVVEQTVKLGISFFLAARMMPYGVQYGAAGALLGVSISEAVAMLGLMLTYWRRRGDMPGVLRASPVEPAGSVIQRLLRLTIPMLLAASVLPLTQMADVAIVMQRLEALGYLKETARELFGILTGFVYPLVNVPSVLSLSLSTSMVPSVAESNARGDIRAVQRKSALGLKIGMLVSIPSAVGMSVLARPIMDLLFGADLMEHGVAIAGDLLVIASLSVLLLAVVQATNGVLQGIGRVRIPMVGLMMGGVTKIITNYILVGIPQINIYGAPVGNILCYLVAAVVNLVALARLTHLRYNWLDLFCKPLLASVMMGLVAYGVQLLVGNLLSAGIATVVAVLAAVPAYVCFALLVGALGREELSMIPGGSRLLPWARRLRPQD